MRDLTRVVSGGALVIAAYCPGQAATLENPSAWGASFESTFEDDHGGHKSNSLLFVAEQARHEITVFDSLGRRIHIIHGPIGNLAMDKFGDLFVADFLGLSFVNEYKPPYSGPPIRLNLPSDQIAWGVSTDEKTGVLAILSITREVGNDAISFFKHGATKPCKVVTTQSGSLGLGTQAAFDAEGTLFFGASTGNGGGVIVASLAGECDAKSIRELSFDQPIYPYGNIAFDKDDNFVIQSYVNDQPGPIYTYRHPKNDAFGPPIAASQLGIYDSRPLTFLTLSCDGEHLWAGDFYGSDVFLYRYPSEPILPPLLAISNVRENVSAAVFPMLVP